MRLIAIINCGRLAFATLFATVIIPAFGQGTLIIQHSGATDPVTEGFQNLGPGSGYAILNDTGVNAWVTPGATNQFSYFKYVLTSQQHAASAGKSWILSADLKIATTNSFPYFGLYLDGFNVSIGLNFGSDSNGDQYVEYLGGSAALGGTVTLPGSDYNNYQVIPTCVQNATNWHDRQHLDLDCADISALWNDATCRVKESGVKPPQS